MSDQPMPAAGGCYVRNKDGSLRRVEDEPPAVDEATPPQDGKSQRAKRKGENDA